jgi:hypothetical protein
LKIQKRRGLIMVRMDGAEARKQRIKSIATYVQAALYQNKHTGFVQLKKTIALLELETGLTSEKIFGILALLQESGQIEIDQTQDQIKKPSVV